MIAIHTTGVNPAIVAKVAIDDDEVDALKLLFRALLAVKREMSRRVSSASPVFGQTRHLSMDLPLRDGSANPPVANAVKPATICPFCKVGLCQASDLLISTTCPPLQSIPTVTCMNFAASQTHVTYSLSPPICSNSIVNLMVAFVFPSFNKYLLVIPPLPILASSHAYSARLIFNTPNF